MPVLAFCLLSVAGILVHTQLWRISHKTLNLKRQDIYCCYLEGSRLVEGANPYERILAGDMRSNRKYATYFPLFYLLSADAQLAGLSAFPAWLAFWRVIFLGCAIGIGYLIFRACAAGGMPLLGLFGVAFWLFNRWTLHVTMIAHIDFLALLFLLLSLGCLPRRFFLGCALFGVSLAIKQIAIFALPLYLIWSWRMRRPDRVQHALKTFALIVAVPLLASAPFLAWNAEGFLRAVLVSATRGQNGHFRAPSLDGLFGVGGLATKLPMLGLLALTYALAFWEGVPAYTSLLLVMTVFFCFNSVLYNQYLVWFLPFIPLSIVELWPGRREPAGTSDAREDTPHE
jgi:uncharacterized membrane protein